MTRRNVIQTAILGLAGAHLPAITHPVALFHEDHLLANESARGFRLLLGARLNVGGAKPTIYAALRNLTERQSQDLTDRVGAGRWVLIESGLSFVTDRESNRHRDQMRDLFGFRLEKTVRAESLSNHYVDYRWPLDCRIRHFTEFAPVGANDREVIAHVETIPAGVRRSVGRGGIIYLGSALGPILAAQDPEATRMALLLARHLVGDGNDWSGGLGRIQASA